jgi:uncharacterized protein
LRRWRLCGTGMTKAVLDSSVLVSAFLTPRGVSASVVRAAKAGAFVLCLSWEIIEETHRSLQEKTKRIRRYYTYPDERIARFGHDLVGAARLVTDLPELRVVPLDPKDDVIVATAVKAGADYLVTGDRHLLTLGEHEGIGIVTPRQFLDLMGGPGANR